MTILFHELQRKRGYNVSFLIHIPHLYEYQENKLDDLEQKKKTEKRNCNK